LWRGVVGIEPTMDSCTDLFTGFADQAGLQPRYPSLLFYIDLLNK
jgi:hypothetical protein